MAFGKIHPKYVRQGSKYRILRLYQSVGYQMIYQGYKLISSSHTVLANPSKWFIDQYIIHSD